MRNAIAFIVLILTAIAIAAVTTHLRPNTASPLPNEVPDPTPPPAAKSAPATSKSAQPDASGSGSGLKKFDDVKEGAIKATLVVADRGTMTLELYPKAAPETVKHFVELCKKNFYQGILFHRVVPNFVIQAGDPKSKGVDPASIRNADPQSTGLGSGGSGSTVPLEATLPHLVNTVGLARSQNPNSGDSQFYINLKDNPDLDGQYCIFGRVISGEDVPAKIQQGDKIERLSVP